MRQLQQIACGLPDCAVVVRSCGRLLVRPLSRRPPTSSPPARHSYRLHAVSTYTCDEQESAQLTRWTTEQRRRTQRSSTFQSADRLATRHGLHLWPRDLGFDLYRRRQGHSAPLGCRVGSVQRTMRTSRRRCFERPHTMTEALSPTSVLIVCNAPTVAILLSRRWLANSWPHPPSTAGSRRRQRKWRKRRTRAEVEVPALSALCIELPTQRRQIGTDYLMVCDSE